MKTNQDNTPKTFQTFQEALDEIARQKFNSTWYELQNSDQYYSDFLKCENEAAELYASSRTAQLEQEVGRLKSEYNDLWVKYDKDLERWQDRDYQQRYKIESLESRVKELELELTHEIELRESYFEDAKMCCDRVKELEEAGKWISVKDRLPEFGVDVLWYTKVKWLSGGKEIRIFADSLLNHKIPVEFDGSFYCLHNENDYLAYDGDYFDEVATHWQPLPESPKP